MATDKLPLHAKAGLIVWNGNAWINAAADSSGKLEVVSSGGGGGGAVTIADGADVAEGAIADAAVTGNNSGTVSAKLRGLSKIVADVWDSVNHNLAVNIVNTSLPLPTGASTSAKQDTGNISLASIDTKTPALGQALAAGSVPIVLTASQLSTLTPPAAITGFATAAKQDTGNTSLASIDGKITAVNTGAVVVSSSVLPTGAATAAKQPALGTAGTASADVITVQGIASMTALKVDASATTQPISGTVTAVQGTAINLKTQAESYQGGTAVGSGNPLQVTLANTGANATAVKVDNSAVTQPTNISQVGGTNIVTGGAAGVLAIGGTVATNTVITANPLNVGAQAVSSENSAVTTARQVQLVADLVGKLIVLPYANPENFVSGAITSAMTGTTSTSLLAAPSSGLRNYITQITISNAHVSVGTDVIIQDGNGGTTLYTIPAAFGYGGAVLTFPTPLRQPTTATAIYCANVTTGASVKASASGYKGI